jgi:hypothetical protein
MLFYPLMRKQSCIGMFLALFSHNQHLQCDLHLLRCFKESEAFNKNH